MDAATAALIGAGIGVFGGGASTFATSWATNRWQLRAAREARAEERRARAYFDVMRIAANLRAAVIVDFSRGGFSESATAYQDVTEVWAPH